MATVFMKWLETSPARYDRGIWLLTLGKIQVIKEKIAAEYVEAGTQVLEIGCGTGTLTCLMAQKGALVSAIDASPGMVAEAKKKIESAGLGKQVRLKTMDATLIGEHFKPASFDLIVSTLVFSELSPDERRTVLETCAGLLKPGGRILLADEMLPENLLSRLAYYAIHLPLLVVTWLLTRTSTHALPSPTTILKNQGWSARQKESYLAGSLVLLELVARNLSVEIVEVFRENIPRLKHGVNLRTLLIDVWCLFFRLIPPYPKVETGLYRVGTPDGDSPLLVTGNFDLTVRRLVKSLDGRVDAWLLVADSRGINVWCAAGGGHFTSEKIMAAMKTHLPEDLLNHQEMILPQLCGNGVDGWRIRKETHWVVKWGPVRAEDIPAYLGAGQVKKDDMRHVIFPLKNRLEMMCVVGGFYALLLGIPLAIFWREQLLPVMAAMLGLSLFYSILLPWIPGQDGLGKGTSLAIMTVVAIALLAYGNAGWTNLFVWNHSLGYGFLAFFVGAEFQGMSPRMRGEEGNWGIEALVGILVLLGYFVPRLAGWWGG